MLSTEAGAWDELGGAGALAVNPFDVAGTADVLHRALAMAGGRAGAAGGVAAGGGGARTPADWLADQLATAAGELRSTRTPSGPSTTTSARSRSSAGASSLRTATRRTVVPTGLQAVEGVERRQVAEVVADEDHGSETVATSSTAVPLSASIGGCSSTDMRAGRTRSPERAAWRSAHARTSSAISGRVR